MTNHEKHIKLWNELSRTGEDSKEEVFRRLFGKEDIDEFETYCFACREDDELGDGDCSYCPIDWGEETNQRCNNLYSPYQKWLEETENVERRKHLAGIIRDLPWRNRND